MLKTTIINLSFLMLLSWCTEIYAQSAASPDFSFKDQTKELLSNPNFKGHLIMGVADLDNDQLDDIIRFSNGRSLEIQMQNNSRLFNQLYRSVVSSNEQFMVCVADVDRNGFNDVLFGENTEGVKLLKFNTQGQSEPIENLEEGIFYVQGTNFVDINNDGWIDIFACDDEGVNKVWINDQQGGFVPNTTLVNLEVYSPAEMNAGNYSSLWTDFDNDGDLDLYISKCYVSPTGPDDVRLINQLFVNEGQQGFQERANEFGLDDSAQSWTSDFQDIDNDGDLDCFIVNHYGECRLLENDGTGHYTDITAQSGLNITENHFQLIMRDFDNDGWIDLMVAGAVSFEVYYNLGNKTFVPVSELFEDYDLGTFAIGDLNHDGYTDIYSGSSNPSEGDVLWINQKEENNNSISISLEGTTSNINAIGSRIEVYGEWGVQVREVRSGESYGIMNSLTQTLGLGSSVIVDSLIIRWPSGIIEKFDEIDANQHIHAVEGDCLFAGKNISPEGALEFCEGEEVVLKAPKGETYLWSTGDETNEITVQESGIYTVEVSNKFGCTNTSNPIEVIVNPDETPTIEFIGDTIFCRGGALILNAANGTDYTWSTGSTAELIIVRASGQFTLTNAGLCEDFTSDPVNVFVLDPQITEASGDTISAPGMVTLRAIGQNPHWYDSQGTLLGTGSELTTSITNSTTYWVEDVVEMEGVRCVSPRVEVNAVLLTSLPQPIVEGDIKVYPNPVIDALFIDAKQSSENIHRIEIMDASGKALEIIKDPKKSNVLHLESFTSGIYFLKIYTDENQYIDTFIKLKTN